MTDTQACIFFDLRAFKEGRIQVHIHNPVRYKVAYMVQLFEMGLVFLLVGSLGMLVGVTYLTEVFELKPLLLPPRRGFSSTRGIKTSGRFVKTRCQVQC